MTMHGESIPYAWLLCMFIQALRGRDVWEKCLTMALEPTDSEFNLYTDLTKSDEAFIISVLKAKGRLWSKNYQEMKEEAWDKLKASTQFVSGRGWT